MKNEAKNLKTFKDFKHIKRENNQKFKPINGIIYSWFKEMWGIWYSCK